MSEALPIVAYRIKVWSHADQSNEWALRFPDEMPSLPAGFTEIRYEGGLTDHATATATIQALQEEVRTLRLIAESAAYALDRSEDGGEPINIPSHLRLEDGQQCCGISTLLCDWKLEAGGTCDAPLCEAHGVQVGDDLHLCPIHDKQRRDTEPELF